MARFKIISKDGNAVRYEGKPRYIGTYLKPSHLEFSEIATPAPIAWEVGDYVDYSRTGMRYYLYSIPQASKNARKDTHGRAFTYSNVQLFAATKELEIAPFRDLVPNDNGIHFSTAPDVATFENVYGIARRIQACMDDLYPGRWEIRVAEFFADDDIAEEITTAKDFALSGGTCLDALSKIYELWQDIGWIHTHEDGMEVITIGYANKRIADNTSDPYLYGKGNGLTAIKKNQTNKEEFATRLYVYGSERNLPSRYYNGLNILNAESVDIRNLMIPLDMWGKTNGLPDARKAYIENAEAVAKYGVIPKTHYFDSADAGADIYPSIEGMTIGQIRKVLADMGDTTYSPSTAIYPDSSERVDEVVSSVTPDDDGVIRPSGKAYKFYAEENITAYSEDITLKNSTEVKVSKILLYSELEGNGKAEVTVIPDILFSLSDAGFTDVRATFELTDSPTKSKRASKFNTVVAKKNESTGDWEFKAPKMSVGYDFVSTNSIPVCYIVNVVATLEEAKEGESVQFAISEGSIEIGANALLDKEFTISLKQIGFSIEERAAIGSGKTISMKSGANEGRNFVIKSCDYQSSSDSWVLTCRRQQDNTLGMLFPNKDSQIEKDDRFVLLDIAMPELYIRVNMERLFSEGEKLLARASKVLSHYEPSIDAKLMIESGRTLREGMFMEISDEDVIDNVTDHILIDTLSIYEDESAIPTYKVTLRERRKVTYKGTPSATSSTDTRSVEESNEVEVDLSNYVTKDQFEAISAFKDWFYLTEDGKSIGTKYNLFSELEISANGLHAGSGGGTGGSSTLAGLMDVTLSSPASGNILVYNGTHWVNKPQSELAPDIDLSDYYTRTEVDTKLGAYIKTTDADTKYAPLSGFNTLKSDFDALNAALNDDVSGKINTWNEIVDFVDEYSGSEDLATIISGLSTQVNGKVDISTYNDFLANEYNPLKTKVGMMEGNVTALQTLTGTHTNQISDLTSRMVAAETAITTNTTAIQAVDLKVTTLGNHMTEVDDTIVVIQTQTDGINERLVDVETWKDTTDTTVKNLSTQVSTNKTNIEKILGWFQLDSSGNLYTTYNFYSTKEISANGLGQGTGGSGGSGIINSVLGVSSLGTSLTEDNTAVFNAFATNKVYNDLVTLTDRVNNLTTVTSAVGWKGEITSGKKIGTLTINGLENYLYIPDKLSAFTDDVVNGKYLPLTGGTLSNGNFNPLTIKGNSSYSGIGFVRSSNDAGYLVYLGGTKWHVTNEGWATGHDLLHLGNYSQYALQASNGDYYGVVFTSTLADGAARLILKNNNDILIGINSDGTNATLVNYKTSEWLGLRDGVLKYYDKVNERIVLHSGNIEDYAMLVAIGSHSNPTSSITKTGVTSWSNGVAAGYHGEYGTSLWVHFNPKSTSGSRWRNRLDFATTGQISLWQGINTETMSYIGELAYMHSNVASATKLQNNSAFYAWGQMFFNNGVPQDANGYMTFNNGDIIHAKDTDGTRQYVMGLTAALSFGYGTSEAGIDTYIDGKNLYLRYGTSHTYGLVLNSSGNIGIGTTSNISSRLTIAHSTTTEPTIAVDDHCKILGIAANKNNWLQRIILSSGWDSTRGDFLYLRTPSSQSTSPFIFMQREGLRVGINTENPEYTLDVDGTLSAGATTLSSLTVNGSITINSGNVQPNLDDARMVGTSSYRFNSGYINNIYSSALYVGKGTTYYFNGSGDIHARNITTTANATVSSQLSVGYTGSHGYQCYIGGTYTKGLYVGKDAVFKGNIEADGEVSGNILNTGSDIRFKNRIEDVVLDLDTMADAPMFRFTWKNRKDDRVYIGSSAQYWKGTNARELVSVDSTAFHRLDYATLGVLMGRSLALEIRELKREIVKLKEENRRLRYGN